MSNRYLIKSLPYLLGLIATGTGVNIKTDPNATTAGTNGTTIFFPPLPYKGDELAVYAIGFLVHEAGHIRSSDFESFRAAKKSPLLRMLINLLEDVRIERLMNSAYPGAKHWLNALTLKLVETQRQGVLDASASLTTQLFRYLQDWLFESVLDYGALKGIGTQQRQLWRAKVSESLADSIDAFALRAAWATSTAEVIDLSEQIIALLQTEVKTVENKPPDPAPPKTAEDGSDAGQDDAAADDGGQADDGGPTGDADGEAATGAESQTDGGQTDGAGQDGSTDGQADEAAQTGDADADGEAAAGGSDQSDAAQDDGAGQDAEPDGQGNGAGQIGDADGDADGEADAADGSGQSGGGQANGAGKDAVTGSQADGAGQTGDVDGETDAADDSGQSGGGQASYVEALQELLQTEDIAEGADRGDVIRDQMQEPLAVAASTHQSYFTLPSVLPVQAGSGDAAAIASVRVASTALRYRMEEFLQASTRKRTSYSESGRRLAHDAGRRMAIGDPRIYQVKSQGRKVDTAVNLLIDLSSSMSVKGRFKVAIESALALGLALEDVDGVNYSVSAFPFHDFDVVDLVEPGENIRSVAGRFASLAPNGGTPLDRALLHAHMKLLTTKASRRVCMVITDGEPDNLNALLEVVAMGESEGVEHMAVGINSSAVHITKNACTVNDLSDLPKQIMSMMQDVILLPKAA
jgi:Mg-chelatase subunit ChlD